MIEKDKELIIKFPFVTNAMANNRSLRDRITLEVLKHNPIPAHKQNNKHMFYFDDYDDNLYTKMSKAVYTAYKVGNGGRTRMVIHLKWQHCFFFCNDV